MCPLIKLRLTPAPRCTTLHEHDLTRVVYCAGGALPGLVIRPLASGVTGDRISASMARLHGFRIRRIGLHLVMLEQDRPTVSEK